jgi:putative transposase
MGACMENIGHRRSIRLKGYDYSSAGGYFITICTQNREYLFGKIIDGVMQLNNAGKMVEKWYFELENKFNGIKCGEFVCMPNHTHFIIFNVGATLCGRPNTCGRPNKCGRPNVSNGNIAWDESMERAEKGEDIRAEDMKGEDMKGRHIGLPVRWFKTMTTNEYIRNVKLNGWQRFNKRLWQRNYYEHIIRNTVELNRIGEYICSNPQNWHQDSLNPKKEE